MRLFRQTGDQRLPMKWPRFAPFVEANNLRLSMHPGQYTILNAQRPEVVAAAVRELEYHAAFLAATDPRSGTMTLHVGGAYGDKAAALARFAANFPRLSLEAQSRLTLENDDRTFSAGEVLGLCETLGTPMIFDFLHHKLNPTLRDLGRRLGTPSGTHRQNLGRTHPETAPLFAARLHHRPRRLRGNYRGLRAGGRRARTVRRRRAL